MAREVYVSRQVIQDQLLVALDDQSKAAIIASKNECELLLRALELAINATPSKTEAEELSEFKADIGKLYVSAFVGGAG